MMALIFGACAWNSYAQRAEFFTVVHIEGDVDIRACHYDVHLDWGDYAMPGSFDSGVRGTPEQEHHSIMPPGPGLWVLEVEPDKTYVDEPCIVPEHGTWRRPTIEEMTRVLAGQESLPKDVR